MKGTMPTPRLKRLAPFHPARLACCDHCPPDCGNYHDTDCTEGCREAAFGQMALAQEDR